MIAIKKLRRTVFLFEKKVNQFLRRLDRFALWTTRQPVDPPGL
jgi:hypothetical protein